MRLAQRLFDRLADAFRHDPVHGHVRRIIVRNKEVLLGAVEREMQGAIAEADRRLKRLQCARRENRKGLNEVVRDLDLRQRAGCKVELMDLHLAAE